MASLISEQEQFVDDDGEPIVNGYIYIGAQNLDAKLNAITIYSDRALTTVLANPQRTDAYGRSVNKIWVPGKYSIKVEDSANVQKLNDLDRGETAQIGNTILDNVQGVNALTATASPAVTALVNGQTYILTAPANNTGAMTLKIDSTPVWPIYKSHDVALGANDIETGQTMVLVWNEADSAFELTSNTVSSTFATPIIVTDTTASTDEGTGSIVTHGGLGVAGDVNIAGALSIGGIPVEPPDTKHKTADQQKTTDTTPAADTHLSGWSLDAGTYYKIEGSILVQAESLTPDLSVSITISNAAQKSGISFIVSPGAAAAATGATIASGVAATIPLENTSFLLDGQIVSISGVVLSHPTLTSTLDFDWSQATSSADAVTLVQGSWITVSKIQ